VRFPLPQLSDFNKNSYEELKSVYKDFEIVDAEKIKETEKITNHDVKAIEYFIKEKFTALGLDSGKSLFISG